MYLVREVRDGFHGVMIGKKNSVMVCHTTMDAREYLVGKRGFAQRMVRRITPRLASVAANVHAASKLARLARDLSAFDGVLPPADEAVSVLMLRGIPVDECVRARETHKLVRRARASSKCLSNNIQGQTFVPSYYFSGFDSRVGVFVVVMGPTGGRPPRLRTVDEFATVERALLSVWILGFSTVGVAKSDVLVRRGTATIVDFSRVNPVPSEWRRSKAANTLTISRTTQLFSEWDSPLWLTVPSTNVATVADARERIWAAALVPCDGA